MSLDVQNPKGIQIKVTSTSTESKSYFQIDAFLSLPKSKQWEYSSNPKKKCLLAILAPPWYRSPAGDKEGTAPLPHLSFSGFLASCGRRCKTAFASALPGVKGKQNQFQCTGCLGPRPEGGLVLCPTPTQPLLCQQHRGALTLPLSRDPGQLPMGLLGFKILQNMQELIELSNNKCLFFSEASFNTYEENPLSKQLVFTCHLWKPAHSFPSSHPFIFDLPVFVSDILIIPSVYSRLPIASCLQAALSGSPPTFPSLPPITDSPSPDQWATTAAPAKLLIEPTWAWGGTRPRPPEAAPPTHR